MDKINFERNPANSKIENEDYFPLRVVFDEAADNICFSGIYFSDKDLLEFATDSSGKIKKMQLVTCRHYSISNSEYKLHEDIENGSVFLNLRKHTDCDCFDVTVWANAVTIVLSSNKACIFYKSGNIVFGVDCKKEIVFIAVVDMSQAEIAHTVSELEEQNPIN